MKNKSLSEYACKDDSAITFINENDDLRPRFFRDSDRIIYSLSYTRYIDKTQVFTFTDNDSTFSFSKNNYVYVSIYILNPLMALQMYNST